MNGDLSKIGHGFDLEQTTNAYRLGGKKMHWTDYSIGNDEWDEDSYYRDFNSWWDELPEDEKVRICTEMDITL